MIADDPSSRAKGARELPAISFVTTCKGRLAHLQASLPRLMAQPDAEVIVVDYACPEGAGDWALTAFPAVQVARVTAPGVFRAADARNTGARLARGNWLCFVDADVLLAADFTARLLPQLTTGTFWSARGSGAEAVGTVVCARADWQTIEGYDEVFEGWGVEDRDFYVRLTLLGRKWRPLPAPLVAVISHSDEVRNRYHATGDRWLSQCANALYAQVKHDVVCLTKQLNPPRATREALYREVQRAVRGAAEANLPQARVDVTLPEELVVELREGRRIRRVLTYILEATPSNPAPAPAPAPTSTGAPAAQAEWWMT